MPTEKPEYNDIELNYLQCFNSFLLITNDDGNLVLVGFLFQLIFS